MKANPATAALFADENLVGTELARAYTAEIDTWLESVVAGIQEVRGVALVAVGGYGRGTLSVGSDLDLLLIHNNSGHVAEVAERIWYPIWDSGVRLGHAVRTIDEALELAADDLDTATSLLDTRLIGGEARLVDELQKKARELWRNNADKMLTRLVESVRERHETSGEVAFLLEPDLKLARGGLRDIDSLHWIDHTELGLLKANERSELLEPHRILLSSRIELHRQSGATGNRLLLEIQDEVAAALGYPDADELMAAVASAARTVAWITDAALHRIHARSARHRWRPKIRKFGHGIEIIDETLRFSVDADISHDPIMPLRVAYTAAAEDAFIERSVLDRLAAETPPMPDVWPDEARTIFVDLLLLGYEAIRVLEALDQVDLLSRFFPEWAPNRSRPQRNVYHRFTVDRHLLETAAEAAAIADRVERPDLLVLGGLFHDIGKGYPGDHSEVGVGLTRQIATRMGYPPADIETLGTMVRHHLLLPDVASRRDLDATETIKFVAGQIDSVGTLELLGALTEADSIATSKAAWGVWKAELVKRLVIRSAHLLRTGDTMLTDQFPTDQQLKLLASGEDLVTLDDHELTVITPDRRGVFSRVAGALALHDIEILKARLHTEDAMTLVVLRVGGAIGLEERPEEVKKGIGLALAGGLAVRARLLKRARAYRFQRVTTANLSKPVVRFFNDLSPDFTVVEVQGPDSIGLLYRITRALDDLDLDIASAKVQTLGDDVVDTFYVRSPDGKKVMDKDYLAEIELAVLTAIVSDA